MFHLRIDNGEGKKLDRVSLDLGAEVDLTQIEAVKLFYGGTECVERSDKEVSLREFMKLFLRNFREWR